MGFQNNITFGRGFKLQPSQARDISDMQQLADDISFINYTGNPEGVISANPGSICLDPVNGVFYFKASGAAAAGWTSLPTVVYPLSLALGGTNANLVASNGGIFYSTATEGAILAGTATANRILMSGSSAAPAWSTATYPPTSGSSGTLMQSNGTNWVNTTATYPGTGGASGTILRSDGTNWVNSTATYPATGGSAGTILRSDGTNWLNSTATYPNTVAQGDIVYASALNTISALTKDTNATRYLSNTGASNNPAWAQVALSTGVSGQLPLANGGTNANLTASNGGIVYSTATAFAVLAGTATAGQMLRSGSSAAPTWSTATFPSTAGTTGTILRSNGTNWVNSTATYPNTTTSNQILYSSTTNTIGEITTSNNSILLTNGSGVPSFGTSLTNDFTFTTSTAATTRQLLVSNTDNTSGTSNASYMAQVGGTSSGDAYFRFAAGTSRNVTIGIDNSDSQTFKVNTGANATTTPSSDTNLLNLTTGGNFTTPLKSCVTADLNTGLTNATGDATFINPIIFDTDTGSFFDQNSNYDTTTGIFTAPVTGKYLVTARVTYNNLGSAHTTGIIRINLNGGTYSINQFNPFACANAAGEYTAEISCILPVAATGTVAILGQVSGGTKVVGVKGNTSGSFTSLSITLIS